MSELEEKSNETTLQEKNSLARLLKNIRAKYRNIKPKN